MRIDLVLFPRRFIVSHIGVTEDDWSLSNGSDDIACYDFVSGTVQGH